MDSLQLLRIRQRVLIVAGSMLAASWALTLRIEAQEWTRFRGPNGSGVSESKAIPTEWTQQNIRWRVELPGEGHSAPVVWGRKIFLTGTPADGSAFEVYCLDSDEGRLLWKKSYPYRSFPKHRFNSFASPTPVVDSDRVYVVWAVPDQLQVAALTQEGRESWVKQLGPFSSQHGVGASPILHEGRLIIVNDQDGPSSILSLDATTGRTVWETKRVSGKTSYSTPCLFNHPTGVSWLICNSDTNGITALDPKTGATVWSYGEAFDKRSVSSPFVAGGLVFGSCGSGGGGNFLIAVEPPSVPGGLPKKRYELKRSAPYVPTSVALGNRLFTWSDAGVVSCLELSSGKVLWQERVGGNFFGSPVLIDGRLFCVSDTGEVAVVSASDQFQLLARNSLQESSNSTPAVAGDRLFVRTLKHLICVGTPSVK